MSIMTFLHLELLDFQSYLFQPWKYIKTNNQPKVNLEIDVWIIIS